MLSNSVPAMPPIHSQKLSKHIQKMIAARGGTIGFDEYMQIALYQPGMGYYAAGLSKFGAAGDFVTAPEMGDLFGRCIANQIQEIFLPLARPSLLEFGAGSGALAATLLNELAQLDALPSEYLILEVSSELRARQQETLSQRVPELAKRVIWLKRLPEQFEGVVLANEVLDAMPVKLFEQDQSGEIRELSVALESKSGSTNKFDWEPRIANEQIIRSVQALNLSFAGQVYRSELHLQANAWVRSLADLISHGVVLLMDYGFPQAEYYHPDRTMGTLMCHYRHHVNDDPFYLPGLQDITAHVDFTAITNSAKVAGFEPLGYATQAAFLLSLGLLDKLPCDLSVEAQLTISQEVKKLTMPHEMGELFKVLALGKNYTAPLRGFSQQNNLFRLAEVN